MVTKTKRISKSGQSLKRLTRKPAFRKYTNLSTAIHFLQTKSITLLDPKFWDDRNDAHFMSEYKSIVGAKTVLAICFTESGETYHHWRVFSNGPDGICIEFDKCSILSTLRAQENVIAARVNYPLIRVLKRRVKIEPSELPFLKRRPYEPEAEYRAVYVDYNCELHSHTVSVDLACVKRITLSPWMHTSLRNSVRKTLKSISGCSKISIIRSTLTGNKEWQSFTKKASM